GVHWEYPLRLADTSTLTKFLLRQTTGAYGWTYRLEPHLVIICLPYLDLKLTASIAEILD
ncbi:MAG: hypothetical protein ACK53Y_18415, partial [bacterium]